VEGDHRAAAWRAMLDHVGDDAAPRVIDTMREALEHWKSYRDDVAHACGLERGPDGRPRLRDDATRTGTG